MKRITELKRDIDRLERLKKLLEIQLKYKSDRIIKMKEELNTLETTNE